METNGLPAAHLGIEENKREKNRFKAIDNKEKKTKSNSPSDPIVSRKNDLQCVFV